MHNMFQLRKRRLTSCILLLLILTGCGGGDEKDAAEDESSATESILLEPEDSAASSAEPDAKPADTRDPLTLADAVGFLSLMHPSDLGLSGTSMTDYHVYPEEGSVLVDGLSCVKLGVYELMPHAGTNQIAGIYLLARDLTALYRLDTNTNTVTMLQSDLLPTDTPAEETDASTDGKDPEK